MDFGSNRTSTPVKWMTKVLKLSTNYKHSAHLLSPYNVLPGLYVLFPGQILKE